MTERPESHRSGENVSLLNHPAKKVMPKQFNLISLTAMSFALLATWNGYGSAVGTGLAEASTAGSFWGFLIAAFMMSIVALGMAELSSAFPVAGGPYVWSYAVARADWAPCASYWSANIGTFGLWLAFGAAANFVASMILAIISFSIDTYALNKLDVWLVYVVVIWSAIALNVFGSRFVPVFNKCMMYLSFSTLLITVLTLIIYASPSFTPIKAVLTDTTNMTGLPDSYAFLLCITNAIYGFLGLDGGAQMSEEIADPGINVPKAMMLPIVVGVVTTVPFALVLMATINDLPAVIHTRHGLPLIEIYYQATGSKTVTVFLLALFALSFFGCVCGIVTCGSRFIWSASQDNCYPFSKYSSQINDRWRMPMNAACLSGFITSLYGLLFIWSTTAFSSMVGASVIFLGSTYIIPQGILFWRGRSTLPSRPFDLGRYGPIVNAISCAWMVVVLTVSCLPTQAPVTYHNMNWISLVAISIYAYIFTMWQIRQRHIFLGPAERLCMLDD